jgi:biotin transport system substrate-specific component
MDRLAVHPRVIVDAVWPASTVNRIRNLVLVLSGSLLIALSAQLQIPLTPVPITAQTFTLLLLAALYGRALGTATIATYLALGLIGLPVFAGGTAGLARLLGPTGGYLLGYMPAAFAVGWLSEKGWDRRAWSTALAMIIGTGIIYMSGIAWLARFVRQDALLQTGVLPFLPGDALKIALATILLPVAWRFAAPPGRLLSPNEP